MTKYAIYDVPGYHLTAQHIFNTILAHIREQGRPAFGPAPMFDEDRDDDPRLAGKDRCLYRTPDGRSCAFGGIIPDQLYHISMENQTSSTLIEHHCSYLYFLLNHIKLIRDCQQAHDIAAKGTNGPARSDDTAYDHMPFMVRFEANMAGVAVNHRLTYIPYGIPIVGADLPIPALLDYK